MRVDTETGLIIHHGVITRSRVAVRLLQLLNFAFGLLYAVLIVRAVLEYIGARQVGFVEFVDRVSAPFYAPFAGVVKNGSDGAGHVVPWSIVVALFAYVVLHAALSGLVRLVARPARITEV